MDGFLFLHVNHLQSSEGVLEQKHLWNKPLPQGPLSRDQAPAHGEAHDRPSLHVG